MSGLHEDWLPEQLRILTLKTPIDPGSAALQQRLAGLLTLVNDKAIHLLGMAPAPDAEVTGAAGVGGTATAGALLAPGTCAAPVSGTLAAGAATVG